MSARRWAWALGALLVAGTAVTAAADDNARKKGGGSSSGGGSESAGARHTGGGSSRSGGEARSGGGSGDRSSSVGSQGERRGGSSGRSSDDPPSRRVTGAEARHPEPGTGHGWRDGRGRVVYGGSSYYSRYPYRSYYRPYWGWYGVPYYDFYWDDPYYYGGYSGGGYYGAGYGGIYSRDRYRYRETGSIRTLVDPEKTKVFVDGYYAGEADDFDGMFQRLYVAPGRHDISFKLDGFRTHVVKVYAAEDHTLKIRHNMERGAGPETVEDLTGGREEPPYRVSDDGRDRMGRAPYDERREAEPRDGREARDSGALRLNVRPDDASIYVDGQFYGSARRASVINLAPGRHRIEVVRPGHRTIEREIEIQPGRTETLSIDLERS